MNDETHDAVDSVVHQHKSTGPCPSAVNDDKITDLFTTVGPIGYESVLLPLKPGRPINAKAHPKRAIRLTQCVESFPRPRGKVENTLDGSRIALAHNVDGPTTRPAVSFLEGPAANGS